MRLKKLQNQFAAAVAEMRSISDAAEKDNRKIGEGEGHEKEADTVKALEVRCKDLQSEIEFEQRLADRERSMATVVDRNAQTQEQRRDLGEVETATNQFKVPATARHHRSRYFSGDDGDERAYKSGMWLRSIMNRDEGSIRFCKEHGLEFRTAQGEGVNTTGGYLVPELLESAVIVLREQYGVFRQNAFVVPMGSDTVNWPRQTGGATVYYATENTATTESNATWDNVQLAAKKPAILMKYSTELSEDAVISLADFVAREMAYQFAKAEDQAGFIGDGTSTYGGIRGVTTKINDGNHAASISTAATGHTAFSSLTLSDFNAVVGTLPAYALPNAKWYFSALGWAQGAQRLAWAGGGNTVETIAGGMRQTFFGFPVVISQVLNATAAADVSAIKGLFGDLSLSSMFGTRRGITIQSSRDRYFELDQIGVLGTQRYDINNHDLGDGTNAGPIVALKTPAS